MLPDPVHSMMQRAACGEPDALQGLIELGRGSREPTADRATLRRALQQRINEAPSPCAEAWMLLATWQESAGERLPALRSWFRASQPSAQRDAQRMRLLGLDTQPAWSARAAQVRRLRAEFLRDSFSDIRREHGPRELFRIERALSGYLGEASVFSSHPTQRPKVIFIPGLRSGGFLDPADHPVVPALMDAFGDIQREFRQAMAEGAELEPFMGAGLSRQAMAEYVSGGAQASWDAIFFYRHGRRYDKNHARFPATSSALDALDLCRIDGQAPEICYSILQPHSRIEPHHGVTNARVVIHIPLQVPQGCFLELTGVGRHLWQERVPLVFDDTFEHAAQNPTDRPRGILLMDAWHPELKAPERAAFRALIEAITQVEA